MADIQFSKPQEYIITSSQTRLLFLAGVGSGKTHIIGFLSGYLIINFPTVFGFIGANTYMQLSQSTLFRVREVWAELYGWREDVDYVVDKKPPKSFSKKGHNFKSYNGITCFKSGAVVFTGSLDNASAHDGKEFTWSFLDETKNSREQDVKETVLTRLRGGGIYLDENRQLTHEQYNLDTLEENDVFNPLYILTSPAKVGWLNEWFKLDDYQDEIQDLIYDRETFFTLEQGNKCVVISSTYHNIQNLPKGYIEGLLEDVSEERGKMLVYGNPFVRTGSEFYSGFQRKIHVTDVPHIEGLPMHISLDQNTVPYITMTLYQIRYRDDGKREIRQFAELCLANPDNRTAKLCLRFIQRWGAKCKHGLFYYGDPAGRHSDTRSNEHDYTILVKHLRRFLNNNSERVPHVHPPVLKRKDFANDLFEGKHNTVILIDRSCKYSIGDFDFVKEDKNGKKLKQVVTDPITGQKYEKYGHTSDAFDYFICKAFENIFVRHYE